MEKRRDNKGRILHEGESQRPDGRYMYRYTDRLGNRNTVYSWKLVSTDKLKEGQKDTSALRDLEKQISKDIDSIADPCKAQKITVDYLYEQFMNTRKDLKDSTRADYKRHYDRYVKPVIGNMPIANVKPSTVKKVYLLMITDYGLRFSTIRITHCLIKQMFDNAVMDEIISSNPDQKAFLSVRKMIMGPKSVKEPLTLKQQSAFIDYIYSFPTRGKLANLFTVLLGTGMRIGEALGLQRSDCDFEEGVIHVNQTLMHYSDETDEYMPRISAPKSAAGRRDIPMLDDVRTALLRELAKKRPKGNCSSVDGYSDFVFLNNNGNIHTYSAVYRTLKCVTASYNKWESQRAQSENRDPCLLPPISPHIFRHTFCTRMCENGMSPKVLQEIMGHSNIGITMNVYAKATKEKKAEEMRMQNKNVKLL